MNFTSYFESLFKCCDGIQEGQLEYRGREVLLNNNETIFYAVPVNRL